MKVTLKKVKHFKLAIALIIAGLVCVMLGFGPFLPKLFGSTPDISVTTNIDHIFEDITTSTVDVEVTSTSAYRIVIPSIGVDMPIIINESDPETALAQGAWHIPGSGRPDGISSYNNMIISAHRFLYTGGPRTFYYLDKVKNGDKVYIYWKNKSYTYEVYTQFIVQPEDVDILKNTNDRILTLFTCHPVFSTKERLVVRAYPVE